MYKADRSPINSNESKLFLKLGMVLLATLLSVGTFFSITASTQAQSSISSSVSACIPKNQVARSDLIGTTQFQGKTYSLLAAYEQGDPIGSDLIISVTNGACERKLYNPTGDRLALASAVPQPVARQLTLQRYRREIKRIGKPTFEKQLDRTQQSRWFDEEVWALQQLGIQLRNTPN